MQLNKGSKKTAKAAEKPVVAAPEKSADIEKTAKPRSSRSSKPKKNELTEMASGTHHHKPSTPSQEIAAPAVSAESKPLSDRPSRTIHPARVAELAYSYWVERGCAHGSSEEDWLRAEKALAAAH